MIIDSPTMRKIDYRIIETERVLNRQQQHYAVIDIGSNSIRLII